MDGQPEKLAALKSKDMKHTITKTPEGYVCQAVNPYQNDLLSNDFAKDHPAFHFIHHTPLPDNSIVDGQDLTDPFLQILDNGQWYTETEHPLYDKDSKTRMAISFKYPELMDTIIEIEQNDGTWIMLSDDLESRVYAKAYAKTRMLFIRKDQSDNHATHQEQKSIRDEMSMDMLDAQMPVGEIESCLNHWSNYYLITRK